MSESKREGGRLGGGREAGGRELDLILYLRSSHAQKVLETPCRPRVSLLFIPPLPK